MLIEEPHKHTNKNGNNYNYNLLHLYSAFWDHSQPSLASVGNQSWATGLYGCWRYGAEHNLQGANLQAVFGNMPDNNVLLHHLIIISWITAATINRKCTQTSLRR